MSWVLRRWLNPQTDEKSTPVPASPSPSPSPTPTTTPTPITTPQTPQSQQSQQPQQTQTQPGLIPNNLKLLLGGLVFFSISTLVTRRTLIRKHIAAIPPFYTSTVYHKPKVNGALDAFEALNIATINTFAVAMIAAGGTLCALNIDSVEDARSRLRKRLGYNTTVGENGEEIVVAPTKEEEEQFERDMEAWLANVLDKKDLKEVRRKVEAAKAAAAQKDQEEK